jgi:hypothetical protein
MLQFDGERAATRAIEAATARYGGAAAWLRHVAIIRRTARGRVSMRLASPNDPPVDVATARSPAEQLRHDVLQLVGLDELLELDASALLLIADGPSCDELEATFAAACTRTCRQQVLEDSDATLRMLLEGSTTAGSEVFEH